MKNVQSHRVNEFASGFIKCINKYLTPEDFEVGWPELVSHHDVQQKSWTVELYSAREKWTEAYL